MFFENKIVKRMIPYPPSFRRMAANTMEPAIGASTWAFGSHKCTLNIGSFTKNPSNMIAHIYEVIVLEGMVQ